MYINRHAHQNNRLYRFEVDIQFQYLQIWQVFQLVKSKLFDKSYHRVVNVVNCERLIPGHNSHVTFFKPLKISNQIIIEFE